MKNYVFVFLLFCLACNSTSHEGSVPQIVIVDQRLKGYLNSFVEHLINKREKGNEKGKSITIDLQKAGDTTIITIVHAIPDIEMTKINGILNVNGYHIYFIGVLFENFYKVNPRKFYKLDMTLLDRRMDNLYDVKFSEPLQWNMAFVRDSLINRYSCCP